MMIFVAFGVFLNFVFMSQQNAIAVLVLVMEYQQAFLRFAAAFRIRRLHLNRRRQRNRPWSWTLPRPEESWFEIHFHNRTIPGDYFRWQLRMDRETFQALVGILGPWLTRRNTRLRECIPPEKVTVFGIRNV